MSSEHNNYTPSHNEKLTFSNTMTTIKSQINEVNLKLTNLIKNIDSDKMEIKYGLSYLSYLIKDSFTLESGILVVAFNNSVPQKCLHTLTHRLIFRSFRLNHLLNTLVYNANYCEQGGKQPPYPII